MQGWAPHLHLQLSATDARAYEVTNGLQRASRRLRSHEIEVLLRTSYQKNKKAALALSSGYSGGAHPAFLRCAWMP
jgi:hypothetical protein